MHMIKGVQVHGKSKVKRKPGWKEAEARHEAFLKKMGVHSSQTKGKPKHENKIPVYRPSSDTVPTSDVIPGFTPKKEGNVYTGTYIKGIGTMHKSNMVPITSGEDAKEIARMRRG